MQKKRAHISKKNSFQLLLSIENGDSSYKNFRRTLQGGSNSTAVKNHPIHCHGSKLFFSTHILCTIGPFITITGRLQIFQCIAERNIFLPKKAQETSTWINTSNTLSCVCATLCIAEWICFWCQELSFCRVALQCLTADLHKPGQLRSMDLLYVCVYMWVL